MLKAANSDMANTRDRGRAGLSAEHVKLWQGRRQVKGTNDAANRLNRLVPVACLCDFAVGVSDEHLVSLSLFPPFLLWGAVNDTHRFVGELARICAPGGRVLVVTWCHRDLEEGEAGLTPKEEKLLGK